MFFAHRKDNLRSNTEIVANFLICYSVNFMSNKQKQSNFKFPYSESRLNIKLQCEEFSPCLHQGDCIDTGGTDYTCKCKAPYSGANCHTPFLQKVLTFQKPKTFEQIFKWNFPYFPFFSSRTSNENGVCQISPCMFEPCMFGGTCDVRGLSFVCDCPHGYSQGARQFYASTSVKSVVSNQTVLIIIKDTSKWQLKRHGKV